MKLHLIKLTILSIASMYLSIAFADIPTSSPAEQTLIKNGIADSVIRACQPIASQAKQNMLAIIPNASLSMQNKAYQKAYKICVYGNHVVQHNTVSVPTEAQISDVSQQKKQNSQSLNIY